MAENPDMISDDRSRRQILQILSSQDMFFILEQIDSICPREQSIRVLNQLEKEGHIEFSDDRNAVGLTSAGRVYFAGGCVERAPQVSYQTTVHGTVGAIGSNNVIAINQEIHDALQKIQQLNIPVEEKEKASNRLLNGLKDFTSKFLAELFARKAGGEF